MILLATILFIAVLATKLHFNVRMWRNKEIKNTSTKTVKHGKEALYVTLALIPSGVLFFFATGAVWWQAALIIAAMLFFNFLNLFDGLYNACRGFGWFFTGSDDADDANTDDFLQRIPLWLHILLKLGGSAVSIILYLETFK